MRKQILPKMINFRQHHDSLDLLEKPVDRLADIFASGGGFIGEDYRKTALCVDFCWRWRPEGCSVVKYCVAVAYAIEGNADRLSRARKINRPIEPLVSVDGKIGAHAYWREHLVFIENVEVVESVDCLVPSAIWVQTCHERPENIWTLPEFVGAGGREAGLVWGNGEIDAFRRSSVSGRRDSGEVIQGGSKIVQGVADNESGFGGNGRVDSEDEALWSSLCITFSLDRPRLCFDPSFEDEVEVLYVMPRPVHLCEHASQIGVLGIET
ncbi:hypothetical protein [Pikeienuella sp. HZG-20]|uniref:hypothetical protein n=1 Tax=Paludibacillus litoralis TaxID=3133267 RepID=UPI0030ED6455